VKKKVVPERGRRGNDKDENKFVVRRFISTFLLKM
jgi:hypothetical protein